MVSSDESSGSSVKCHENLSSSSSIRPRFPLTGGLDAGGISVPSWLT